MAYANSPSINGQLTLEFNSKIRFTCNKKWKPRKKKKIKKFEVHGLFETKCWTNKKLQTDTKQLPNHDVI